MSGFGFKPMIPFGSYGNGERNAAFVPQAADAAELRAKEAAGETAARRQLKQLEDAYTSAVSLAKKKKLTLDDLENDFSKLQEKHARANESYDGTKKELLAAENFLGAHELKVKFDSDNANFEIAKTAFETHQTVAKQEYEDANEAVKAAEAKVKDQEKVVQTAQQELEKKQAEAQAAEKRMAQAMIFKIEPKEDEDLTDGAAAEGKKPAGAADTIVLSEDEDMDDVADENIEETGTEKTATLSDESRKETGSLHSLRAIKGVMSKRDKRVQALQKTVNGSEKFVSKDVFDAAMKALNHLIQIHNEEKRTLEIVPSTTWQKAIDDVCSPLSIAQETITNLLTVFVQSNKRNNNPTLGKRKPADATGKTADATDDVADAPEKKKKQATDDGVDDAQDCYSFMWVKQRLSQFKDLTDPEVKPPKTFCTATHCNYKRPVTWSDRLGRWTWACNNSECSFKSHNRKQPVQNTGEGSNPVQNTGEGSNV